MQFNHKNNKTMYSISSKSLYEEFLSFNDFMSAKDAISEVSRKTNLAESAIMVRIKQYLIVRGKINELVNFKTLTK